MLLAIAPKDGLAKDVKAKNVKKDDTLLFVDRREGCAHAAGQGDG